MEHYLGEKLKKLRESRGWTQADLAKRLNKAVSTISGYESDAADSGLCAACIVQRTENAEPAPNGIYPDFHPKQQGYLCQSVW